METSNNQFKNATPDGGLRDRNDDMLWQIAKKRASFKWSLASYIVMNCFFVAIWYFTGGEYSYFWPIWPMLGWGLGIVMHYIGAYHGSSISSTEKEYEKLKRTRL